MVDASEFVDGASLDVRHLVGTIVGGLAIAIWNIQQKLIVNFFVVTRRILTAPFETTADLIDEFLAAPTDAFDAGITAGVEFIRTVGALGPLNFIWVTALVTAGLLVISWTIENAGVV